jgi:hydrogenase nickel incorporation protein HypB
MDQKIQIDQNVLSANEKIAQKNRDFFERKKLVVINLISSPGSGKTSILEKMAQKYGQSLCVITGDIQTTIDADRLISRGARALQIETGGSCHLTARMIEEALSRLELEKVKFLVIENIGNLVCPSTYDLGENLKIAVLSVTEGDEKPVKYPALFTRAHALIVNKIDLLDYVDFNMQRIERDCYKLNNRLKIFPLSCKTGAGFDKWFEFFEQTVL